MILAARQLVHKSLLIFYLLKFYGSCFVRELGALTNIKLIPRSVYVVLFFDRNIQRKISLNDKRILKISLKLSNFLF